MNMADSAIAYFDKHRDAFLADLMEFLRFRTISTQPEHARELQQCAHWICKQLTTAGFKTEIIPTANNPIVFADSGPTADNSHSTTLLFYGHYDVQPVGDPNLWNSPAFEPTIREGAIYARGSADDKGQLMTHLAAMRCWHEAVGTLPLRIKFLIEGEEEIGSPNLSVFIKENTERLSCDYVVISDTSKYNANTPAIVISTRGVAFKQITIESPSHDLHSGQYGGTVENPANILARIIASLHDDNHRVTIPGFYDDVIELPDDERQRLIEHGLTDEQVMQNTDSPAVAGELGYTTAERCTVRPTLDVNGIIGGYTGEGGATIIPARATAKISMRLVAGQDPAKISQAFDLAVKNACPPGVRLQIEGSQGCPAYQAPHDSPGIQAAQLALEATFENPPVFSREGGTLPILPMFKQVLGADSIMLGFAMPNCNLHGPNEFFHIKDFEDGTRCILRFIETITENS